jgi:hypothetical protein
MKYSNPVTFLKKMAKFNHVDIDIMSGLLLKGYIEKEMFGNVTATLLEYEVIKGDCIHLFIKDNLLFELLINSPIKINMTFDSFFEYYPFFKEDDKSKSENIKSFNLVVNHKYSSNSILISAIRNYTTNILTFTISDGVGFCAESVDLNKSTKNFKVAELSSDFQKYFNLFFNCIFYAVAFPDKLLNGVPEDFRNVGFHNGKKFVKLETQESLIIRSGVTPHFRSGHFAKLESERYVNKRGQIIWVSSSFVKGYKAKTEIL